MIELSALVCYAGLLAFAAFSDIRSLTIPNWVSIALSAIYPIAGLAAGLPLTDIGIHFLLGFGVLVVGFLLFQANIIGGGDAKLLAATAIWTGPPALLTFLFWTTLAGGLMALSLLLARQFLKQTETNPAFVNRLLKTQNGIPYGLAIMAGGLMALPALPVATSILTPP